MPSTNNIYIGRAAEFLAAHTLELYGLRATHVDLPFDDLWVNANGRLTRVQVKGSIAPLQRKDRPHISVYNFRFSNHPTAYDGVVILVALDLKLCLARTWDDTPPQTLKVNPKLFTPEAEEQSFREAFKL